VHRSLSLSLSLPACPGLTRVTGADRDDDLANVDTGDGAVGLAPGTAHARLQSVCAGARQHLVDAHDVVRVGAHAHVEALLATRLDEVPGRVVLGQDASRGVGPWAVDPLVGADAGRLESLGAQLLVLVRDEVDTQREVIDAGLLATEVEDADLGVGDTAVEARLGVRLRGCQWWLERGGGDARKWSSLVKQGGGRGGGGGGSSGGGRGSSSSILAPGPSPPPVFALVSISFCCAGCVPPPNPALGAPSLRVAAFPSSNSMPLRPRACLSSASLPRAPAGTHLVLAVTVAASGTAGHFDGICRGVAGSVMVLSLTMVVPAAELLKPWGRRRSRQDPAEEGCF
jgi:hypothetical protein